MKLVTIERSQTTKLFWFIAGLLFAALVLTAEQSDPGVAVAGVALALTAMLPLYLWLLGVSHGLPIWPVFSLITGLTYAMPMIQNSKSLADYKPAEIITGGMATVGFLLLGTAIWASLTAKAKSPPPEVLMIEQAHSVRYLLLFVGAGLLFGINQVAGWVTFEGNLMPVARGITMSMNTMGLFVLAYYMGRGLLDTRSAVLFVIGAVATMMVNMTSLMLAQAIVPAALVVFGYMLGSNKLPWRVLLIMFVVMGLLHPGKYEMRKAYWSGEDSKRLTMATLPEFYWEWFSYGFEEIGGLAGFVQTRKKEEETTSIFERSGNLHMLLLVLKKTPSEVPFFDGATYAPIPRLLIPRFIDDEKGLSHMGNIILTVNYGLQTLEQTQTTSIGWGLIPEAYANFGYLGIAGLAIVLAIFYSMVTRMTVGVPMTSLRFVLGLLIMAAATRADTMGVFVTTQFQGVVGVSLAAMVLMRRQRNPFAEGGDQRTETGRWRSEDRDRRAETSGQRSEGGGQGSEIGSRKAESGKRMEGSGAENAERGKAEMLKRDRNEEIGMRKAETGERRGKLTHLRHKAAAGTPKRGAPWMTQSMRKRIAGGRGGAV